MLHTEQAHVDEYEIAVQGKEWQPAKSIKLIKDPFNFNVVKITMNVEAKVKFGDKGWIALFIDDEPKPRIVVETDLPYYYSKKGEADTWDLPYGHHTLKLKAKTAQGKPIALRTWEIYITRFFNLKELIGFIVPLGLMT